MQGVPETPVLVMMHNTWMHLLWQRLAVEARKYPDVGTT